MWQVSTIKRRWIVAASVVAAVGALVGCQQQPEEEESETGGDAISRTSEDFERHVTCLHHRRVRTKLQGHNVARAFHLKNQGCLKGEMYVDPNLPADLRLGILAKEKRTTPSNVPYDHKVWMRLTNINQVPDSIADLRGLALKVLDVKGAARIQGDPIGGQDFLMNDINVHFLNRPEDVLRASEISEKANKHLGDAVLLATMLLRGKKQLRTPNTLLNHQYHSRAPFKLGDEHVIRYYVETCAPMVGAEVPRAPQATPDVALGDDANQTARKAGNHLSVDLATRANAAGGVCLLLQAQLRDANDRRGVDDYVTPWTEAPTTLATIVFPAQDIHAQNNEAMCEALQFSPLNTLPEHAGVGLMNKGREWIYAASRAAGRKTQRQIEDAHCEEIFSDFYTKGVAPPANASGPDYAMSTGLPHPSEKPEPDGATD